MLFTREELTRPKLTCYEWIYELTPSLEDGLFAELCEVDGFYQEVAGIDNLVTAVNFEKDKVTVRYSIPTSGYKGENISGILVKYLVKGLFDYIKVHVLDSEDAIKFTLVGQPMISIPDWKILLDSGDEKNTDLGLEVTYHLNWSDVQ